MKLSSLMGFLFLINIHTMSAADPAIPYKDASLPVEKRVDDLLGRMTLEEKVAQLRHIHSHQFLDQGKLNMNKIEGIAQNSSFGCIEAITLPGKDCAEAMHNAQRYMVEKTRLGIPVLTVTESLHGSAHDGATIFPQSIALGSTFNTELAAQMTAAISSELKEQGIWQSLSPGLDVVRDLRWGRVEESFGEDPFLVARMAIAETKGYLENGISPMLKPLGAHGGPMGGLNLASATCGEREMLNIYLKPYEDCIKEAQPLAVMSSYNSWNNEPNSSSYYLQTELLRNQWGFQGYLYSDWGAVSMLQHFHKTAHNNAEATVQALTSGLDLEAGGNCYAELVNLIKTGQLDEKYVDQAVKRVLRTKFALGMFEHPYRNVSDYGKTIHSKEHVALARKIAEESLVLIKNQNNLLPLNSSRIKSLALIGPNADQVQFGDYTWSRNNKDGVTLAQAVKEQYGDRMTISHARGCDLVSHDKSGFAEAVTAAKNSDVSVIVVGSASASLARDYSNATCGEGFDLSNLDLPGVQEDLIKAVHAEGKPVIVVLLSGKPFSMPWVKENIPAVVVQWYPGEQGGYALADMLFGKVNPSGKLNFSFPQSVGHLPCYYNHLPTDKGFYKQPGTPDKPGKDYVFSSPASLWAFGHGLSYTNFEYVSVATDKEDYKPEDSIKVTVKVKNTGDREGREVVQVYVRDIVSSVVTPVHELKGFKKVLIDKGDMKDVEITIPIKELALYNHRMEKIVEPGAFELQIGRASDDIRLKKMITVNKDQEKTISLAPSKSLPDVTSGHSSAKMEITGVVRDVQANLLSGVPVQSGDVIIHTDKKGKFTIKCPANGSLKIGGGKYRQEAVPVNGQKIINITVLQAN